MFAFNKIKNHLQTTFFILVAILLFVNACPVKKGFQSQNNFTSHALKNGNNKVMSAKEICAIDSEIEFASIGQTPADWNSNLIPILLFTAFFTGIFSLFFFRKEKTNHLFVRTPWTSALPLHVKHCVFIL